MKSYIRNTFIIIILLSGFKSNAQVSDSVYFASVDSLSIQVSMFIGDGRMEREDYIGAIESYSGLLEKFPQYYPALYSRGKAKLSVNDNYGAIADFNKVIQIKPTYIQAIKSRGIAKSNLKDYSGAISDYNLALTIDSLDSGLYVLKASAKWQFNQDGSALQDLTKAIELNPNNYLAFELRGLILILNLKKEEGCLDFSRAGELGSKRAYEYILNHCK